MNASDGGGAGGGAAEAESSSDLFGDAAPTSPVSRDIGTPFFLFWFRRVIGPVCPRVALEPVSPRLLWGGRGGGGSSVRAACFECYCEG